MGKELPEEGKYGTKVTVDNKIEINYDELIKIDIWNLSKIIYNLYKKMNCDEFCDFIKKLYKKFPENDKKKRKIEGLSKNFGIKDLLSWFSEQKKTFNDE